MLNLRNEVEAYCEALKRAGDRGAPMPGPHGRLQTAMANVNRRNRRWAYAKIRRALKKAKRRRETVLSQ